MRTRDVGIILLCVIGLLVALNQEGSVSLNRAFEHLTHKDHDDGDDAQDFEDLISPVVSDVDADGKNEIIIARDDRIEIFSTEDIGHQLDELHTKQFVDINALGGAKKAANGRRIIAISSGAIQSNHPEQVIVAVTNDYRMFCFDHQLRYLWDTDILSSEDQGHTEHGSGEHHHTSEPSNVVIAVLPRRVLKVDTGLIVVGMKTNIRYDQGAESDRVNIQELLNEQEKARPHYSYFAFEGRSGQFRWKHDSLEFKSTQNQNYKLFSINNEHHGEVSWKNYQRGIIRNLPHRFEHSQDTHFNIDHFDPRSEAKQKNVPQAKEKNEEHLLNVVLQRMGGYSIQTPAKASVFPRDNPTAVSGTENVIVAHIGTGVEVLHMYTGHLVCQLSPLEPDVLYDDVNGDGIIEQVSAGVYIGPEGKQSVAQVDSGLFPVKEHLYNVTIDKMRGFMDTLSSENSLEFLLKPASDNFNQRNADTVKAREALGTFEYQLPAPISINRWDLEENRFVKDLIFAAENGIVTSLRGSTGDINWQLESMVTWTREDLEVYFPSVDSLRLPNIEYIVLVNWDSLVVISPDGVIQVNEYLPSKPMAPLVFADINGDGLNDIIVIAQHGYFGFVTHLHTGMNTISTVVVALLLFVGLAFLSRYIEMRDPEFERRSEKRATD